MTKDKKLAAVIKEFSEYVEKEYKDEPIVKLALNKLLITDFNTVKMLVITELKPWFGSEKRFLDMILSMARTETYKKNYLEGHEIPALCNKEKMMICHYLKLMIKVYL